MDLAFPFNKLYPKKKVSLLALVYHEPKNPNAVSVILGTNAIKLKT